MLEREILLRELAEINIFIFYFISVKVYFIFSNVFYYSYYSLFSFICIFN